MMQEDHNVGKWISILYRQSQMYISKPLKAINITVSEYIFIIHIAQNIGINQKALSDLICIDEALTTRSVRSLEEKGFVVRRRSQEDKRAYVLSLTPKGDQVYPEIIQILDSWTESVTRDLNNGQMEVLYQSLIEMADKAIQLKK